MSCANRDGVYAEVGETGAKFSMKENVCYDRCTNLDQFAGPGIKHESNSLPLHVSSCAISYHDSIAVGYSLCMHSFCSGDF